MKANLEGKKLLLVGGINLTSDIVELAHRNGVSVGVTDFNHNTLTKKLADYAYDVDALDVEGISKLYTDEKYDGIITQFLDLTSPCVCDVVDIVGGYSPFTKEQLKMSTDKKYFKDMCISYDLPVPKEFEIDDDYSKIVFPVIVKPVDSSSCKGISICNILEELKRGIHNAKEKSLTKTVIVEEYLPYDEINITYIAQDGNIQLAAIHDRYFNESQDGVVKVPDMYIYPSRYTAMFYEKYNNKIINMLKGIGVRNGSLFMQAIVKDGTVYLYEAGMRLNGCKTYQILEVENGYNTFERLINFALTGSMGDFCSFNAKFKKWYATWNVVGKPGMTCDDFVGEDILNNKPWLVKISGRYGDGEKIPDGSKGTLVQLVARIHIYGNTREELIEHISELQNTFKVFDKEGNNVLLLPHDINDLRRKIDYNLFL